MRSWEDYAAEAEASFEESRSLDERGVTEIATRRREEAAVLASLAVVAALTAET